MKRFPSSQALPNTPLYDMIRFWGRKPWNLVRGYIECCTKVGDCVLDPFAGCGVVAVESLKLKRRTIYNDLNKFCRLIARVSTRPVDTNNIERDFEKVMDGVKRKAHPVIMDGKRENIFYEWLYLTRCKVCGSSGNILGVTYTKIYTSKKPPKKKGDKLDDIAIKAYGMIKKYRNISHGELVKRLDVEARDEDITRAINEKLVWTASVKAQEIPVEIQYVCDNEKCSAKKGERKRPDREDIKKITKINKMRPVYYHPQKDLTYPDGKLFLTYRPGTESVEGLFTKRNLIALSILKNEIDHLKDKDVREKFLLCFAAILEHTSKMERPNKKGWAVKNYIIHPTFLEQNVLHVFSNRYKTLLEGAREANEKIGKFKETKEPSDVIIGEAAASFLALDARKIPISNDSVDYIFTDPEYGESVQYYELSLMAAAWLNIENDWRNEIVKNDNQGKSVTVYRNMLKEAFREAYRVLKPNKYITITFHSREIKYWNTLMFAVQSAGFEYVAAIYQTPQREYTNWIKARSPGEMRGDIYVTFKKPRKRKKVRRKELTFLDLADIIKNVVIPRAKETILLHDGKASYDAMARAVTLKLIEEGLMHNPLIRDMNYEKLFDEYFEKHGRKKIWKLKEEVSPIEYIPLGRRIDWLIYSVFNKVGRKVTVDDILCAIFTTLRNAKTPETTEIMEALREIADPVTEKKKPYWVIKKTIQTSLEEVPSIRIKEVIEREELDHARLIKFVSDIGRELGFDIYIGKNEMMKNPALDRYRDISLLEIPGLDYAALERLENVDVIWLKERKKPKALIEVENTTDPRVGLLRMANVFESQKLKVDTFSILPDARMGGIEKILNEPSIKKLIDGQEIHFASYSDIAEFQDELEYLIKTYEDFKKNCKCRGGT